VSSSTRENTGLVLADWERLTDRVLAICRIDRYFRSEARDWTQEILTVVARDLSRKNIRTFEEAYHYALAVLKNMRHDAQRWMIKREKTVSIDQETEEGRRVKQFIEQGTDSETPEAQYERTQKELTFMKLRLALHDCVGLAAGTLTDENLRLLVEYSKKESYDGDWTEYLAQKYGAKPGTIYTRVSRARDKLTGAAVDCMSHKGYALPEDQVKDYIDSYINEL
jgi:hypothetical protein